MEVFQHSMFDDTDGIITQKMVYPCLVSWLKCSFFFSVGVGENWDGHSKWRMEFRWFLVEWEKGSWSGKLEVPIVRQRRGRHLRSVGKINRGYVLWLSGRSPQLKLNKQSWVAYFPCEVKENAQTLCRCANLKRTIQTCPHYQNEDPVTRSKHFPMQLTIDGSL